MNEESDVTSAFAVDFSIDDTLLFRIANRPYFNHMSTEKEFREKGR